MTGANSKGRKERGRRHLIEGAEFDSRRAVPWSITTSKVPNGICSVAQVEAAATHQTASPVTCNQGRGFFLDNGHNARLGNHPRLAAGLDDLVSS
jgi:hypothetical protein